MFDILRSGREWRCVPSVLAVDRALCGCVCQPIPGGDQRLGKNAVRTTMCMLLPMVSGSRRVHTYRTASVVLPIMHQLCPRCHVFRRGAFRLNKRHHSAFNLVCKGQQPHWLGGSSPSQTSNEIIAEQYLWVNKSFSSKFYFDLPKRNL